MNAPTGFAVVNGQAVNINPIAAMLNRASLHETIHMVLALPFTTFTIVYLLLGVIVIFLLRRQFMETRPGWIKKDPINKEPLSHA